MFPRLDLPFYLVVDSSAQGIGYVLYQKHDDSLDYEFADAQITRIVNNACDDTKKFRTIFANV
jgi:hypothetical protein